MTHMDQIRDCILHDTDPLFSAAVNRYGCRVFVLLAIPQVVMGRCLSASDIHEIIELGRAVPDVIINDKLKCGIDEHKLINWGFNELNSNRRGRQVGWDLEHVTSRWWEYMMAHWETDGPDGHVTLFDRAQKEIYDPHDPEQAGYEINKKRIVRRLLYRTWEVGK